MSSLTLPADWTVQPLGALCAKPEYGLTETASNDRVGPRFVRITDIQDGEVAWDTVPFCHCSEMELERHRIQRGDLLIARIGATTGKTFLVRDCPEEAVFASYLIRVRPNAIHDRYLYYFCQSSMYWDHINAEKDERLKGGVNSSVLTHLPIIVPPSSEQIAIADVLERVETAAKVESTMERKLRDLKSATMAKVFREGLFREPLKQSETGDIPNSWETTTLGLLCDRSGGCIQTGPFGSQLHAHEYQTDGVPVINPTHLEGNYINHAFVPRVSEQAAERLKRHRVEAGDILFGRRGEIGRHGLVSSAEAGWLCGTGCFLVRVRCPEVDNAFVSYLLSTERVVEWLVAHAAGTIMPNLNNVVLSRLPVIIPAITEQRDIVAILSAIDKEIELRRKKCSALQSLFKSLLHVLTTGVTHVTDITPSEVVHA